MRNRKRSEILSLVACYIALAIVTAGVFFGPWAVKMWFCVFRGWDADGAAMVRMVTLFKACYYPSALLGYVTLYSLIHLLLNIKKDIIFVHTNVRYLRCISWCCVAVSAITLLAGIQYLPYLFISVAAGFVGLMLRVVKNVVQSAVELREENELTI